jgi:leucyl aminopeptidase
VYNCRNLVNEPVINLSATQLAEHFEDFFEGTGVKVDIFNKKKIEALKMGGLLAVNSGSSEPPTFSILEWKPANAKNQKPVVLVGKGVTFDTGGMNIKTGSFMDHMKTDMSGAATVASVVYAIAKSQLPVYVMAFIPATDNRINSNAIVSGDVLVMHSGKTVEVLNTDAEGRLILADALSYAQAYDPLLAITVATLTGSAARAIGKYGIVAMQNNAIGQMQHLKESGDAVHERIAEFPFWDDYAELIKSDVADLKNIGPMEGGAITAGKFLQAFTSYPFIHLDIAGCAYAEKRDSYRNQGATGMSVRLLIQFLATAEW